MADKPEKAEHHGSGHRARLRGRLLEQGGDALLDHELVEYLLALAIPRIDTKPLAKRLLAHYGGLSALLTADAQNIARQPGMGETSTAALKIVQAAALRLLREPVREQPVLAQRGRAHALHRQQALLPMSLEKQALLRAVAEMALVIDPTPSDALAQADLLQKA